MKLDAALADLLIERGATETEILLLEQSSAFLTLLDKAVFEYRDECTGCGEYAACKRDCAVVNALHETGDPRLAERVDRAWDDASDEEYIRTHPLPPLRNVLTVTGIMTALEQQAVSARQPEHYFINSRDAALIEQSGARVPAGITITPSQFVPEGTAYLLGEQPPLDDAPAVDDGHGLDVDDP